MPELHFLVPREFSEGLNLAGGNTIPVRDARTLRKTLQHLIEEEDVRAVVVPEHLLVQLDAREIRTLLTRTHPCIIPLPMDWQASRDVRQDVEQRVQHILGFKIPISDQLLQRSRHAEEAPA